MRVSREDNQVSVSLAQNGKKEGLEKGKLHGKQEKKDGGSVFAGDLNMQEDKITMQKRKLLKDALKVMMNQFKGDSEIDDEMAEREQNMADCQTRMDTAQDAIKELEQEKTALQEKYGVTQDSQEHKDYELIVKGQRASKEHRLDELSEEELTRLSEMGPLTNYQRQALGLTSLQDTWREEYEDAKTARVADSKINNSIKLSLLGRKYDMSDAARTSGEMQKRASKEIASMMVSEAKEHIDEEFEKLQEEAEEAKDKKKAEEEQNEKIKKAKDKITEQEKKIEEAKKNGENTVEFAKPMELEEIEMLPEMLDMPEEDIKGLKIDLLL